MTEDLAGGVPGNAVVMAMSMQISALNLNPGHFFSNQGW